eukprot:EG_transcript_23513
MPTRSSTRRPLDVAAEPSPKKQKIVSKDVAHGPSPPAPPPSTTDPVQLAQRILGLTDPYLILSTAGEPLSAASPDVDVRRAYLRLSAKIHPDKLDGMAQANEAFQRLLKAYEAAKATNASMKDPPPKAKPKAKPKAQPKVQNSNNVQEPPDTVSGQQRPSTRCVPGDLPPATPQDVYAVPLPAEAPKDPKPVAKPPPTPTAAVPPTPSA